jgi:glycosyltransferase involved in cell wall biosynthesis
LRTESTIEVNVQATEPKVVREGEASSQPVATRRGDGEVLRTILHSGLGELRTELLKLQETVALVQAEKAELERGLSCSPDQVKVLTEEKANVERQLASLVDHLSQIERSLAWVLIQKARGMRLKLLREGTFAGRCWSRFSRFARTALTQGMTVAVRKALAKIAQRIDQSRSEDHPPSPDISTPVLPQTSPVVRFTELPWRFLAGDARPATRRSGSFKILLVAHSACRTRAPLCLLRLAQELARLPDLECWVVLQQGGELADRFASIAPTLHLNDLMGSGVSPSEAIGLIASTFREYADHGLAICNTVALNRFHAAFADQQVPVLSWIHELPTFIEFFRGRGTIEVVEAASRKIIVPADVVRDSLIEWFDIDPDRIRTIYYGIDPRTWSLSREAMRRSVREELGLPGEAQIVLGCGTVDLRKGADLFVSMARRFLTDPRAAELAAKTWFVWVGHGTDAELRRWLLHDAAIGGLEDRIRFIGPRADTAGYFLAADLFALTSREDPCPLVNQEAMESGLAVVAFRSSGGGPEVLGDAGVAVPYLDVDAMAVAVRDLLADPARRSDMGQLGRARIRGDFTWPRFMEEFLELLQTDYQYLPAPRLKVSVIVPNYRHARFLEDRLRSIFDQTLRPHEIFFLDDASTDESVEVARRLAASAPVPMRILVNEQNGGTFRQWVKGLELVTGDLVWIAEADDAAHPEFLERLVPEFYDPEVVLAYCQSAVIGSEGEKLEDNYLGYTDDISTTRWRSRYSVSGIEEVELALSQKNTIPNASAVLFRRPHRLDFAEELVNLRFAGDWLFYARQIRTGKITFLPEALNYHRRHEQTNTHHSHRGDTHAVESLYVRARVFETFPVSTHAINRSLGQSVLEYNLLTEGYDLKRPPLTANAKITSTLNRIRAALTERRTAPCALKVLLLVDDMEARPGTLSAIHLANALANEHEVFLCNARPHRIDQGLVDRVDRRVNWLEGTLGPSPWSQGVDLASESGHLGSRRRVEILKELIRFHRIAMIHSRSTQADGLVLQINEELNVPWFTHLPGARPASSDAEVAGPGSDDFAARIASAATGLFYEHESQLAVLERSSISSPKHLIRLSHGFDPEGLPRGDACGIPKEEGVLLFFLIPTGLSGDPDWRAALASVQTINALPPAARGNRRARLVLADGESTSQEILERLGSDDSILLLDGSVDPLAALMHCDAVLGLGATATGDESAWVIAALAGGKPVIVGDQGSLPNLIADGDRSAGILLSRTGRSGAPVAHLVEAMLEYVTSPHLYAAHASDARWIFKARYAVDRIAATCTEAYLEACNVLAFQAGRKCLLPRACEASGPTSRRFA